MVDEKKYLDKTGLQHVLSGMKTKLAGKSDIDHTHKYAGSSAAGGSALSSEKLDTAAAGSATQPVYFADGKPVATTYTLGKSVPADAVFTDTDTHYASKNVVGSSTATDDTTSALANGNVYINSVENGAVTSAHKISGTGTTTVTADASGNIVINSTEHPTSIKNPNAITISLNGTSQGAYDGSAAKSINVTASSVGAYAKSEVDSKLSTKYGNDILRTKNTVLAAPATADGSASFRTLTAADIPAVNASAINGTIAAANLPSFVDDVLEGYYNSSDSKFYKNYNAANKAYSDVYTGETGKIYVDLADNKTYRWGGSAYVVISDTIALGETSTTAYRGDYGKVAYDHAVAHGSAFDSGLYKVQTNSEGHVTGATVVVKKDITDLGIPAQDTVYTHPTTSGNKHIPSGGSDGQILYWSADGTADWGDMPNVIAPLKVDAAPVVSSSAEIAIGTNAHATGSYGVAIGISSEATTNNSVAIGSAAHATGSSGVVIGSAASAQGSASIAIGPSAKSTSDSGISIGGGSSTQSGIAIGSGAYSYGTYSMCMGSSSKCTESRAVALGVGASSSGSSAVAIGDSSSCNGYGSVAIGAGSRASEQFVFSVGDASQTRRIVNVTDPTNAQDAATKGYVDSLGEEKLAACEAATKAATEAAASATASAEKADAAALRANAAAGAALQGLTWAKVSELVKSGDAPAVFPVGSQFTTRLEGNGYAVEAFAWDVIHHFDGSDDAHPLMALSDGTQARGMMLQAHRTVPWAIVWEPKQAAIAVTGDMPAGTYHFTVKITTTWGSGIAAATGSKTYQFTTTKAMKAGAQLVWSGGSYSTKPTAMTLQAYASGTSTDVVESCAVTEGSSGTDLGTTVDNAVPTNSQSYAMLNNPQRSCYGSNRWKTSQERVALNATGAIAQGGDAFSRLWGLVGKTGLLGCLPEDFVGVLGEVERKQELHTWDGGAVEAVYDRMFPVSAREHGFSSYLAATTAGFEAEGVPLDYWTQLRTASGRTSWGGWQTYPELITYDSAATTTARYVWLRSAHRSANYAYVTGGVYTSGTVTNLNAYNGYFAAPACLIV